MPLKTGNFCCRQSLPVVEKVNQILRGHLPIGLGGNLGFLQRRNLYIRKHTGVKCCVAVVGKGT